MERTEQAFTREVKIGKLLANGVIQEDIQEIEHSYVHQEFMQAFDVLRQILKENEQYHNALLVSGTGRNKPRMGEIFNVIPFLGERGTGKTSTMLSFAHILDAFTPERQEYASLLVEGTRGQGWRELKFVILDYIDVGILKNKEDIMSIILARMLKYVRRAVKGDGCSEYGVQAVRQEELHQLYQSFEGVYSNLLNLTEGERYPAGESALRRLQSLSSSHSLSEAFQELVEKFLRFLGHNAEGQYRHFLVISLDDIDLCETAVRPDAREKDAYTVLGQIYQYLQIPNVIVLTTFDESRLVRSCAAHISWHMNSTSTDITETAACMPQAIQYIQKVILPKYKIYMPSLNYADYLESRQLNIVVDKDDELWHVFSSLGKDKRDSVKLTPKDLNLQYLAKVYGLYFDSGGKKQHFFEERNLRRLKNLLLALRTEDETPYSEADQALREQRYMHLLSYIYNQFIREKLADPEESALLQRWLSMPVARRSKEILEYIRQDRAKLNKESPHCYKSSRDEGTYSYGELIHNLYHASRCSSFSKEMVHCILASYSLVLPYLYEQCGSKHPEDASKAFASLRNVLGTSISGRWSNEILYTLFMVDRDPVTETMEAWARIGSVSTRACNKILKIPVSKEQETAIRYYLMQGKTSEEKYEESLQSARRFLRSLELLGMFFTNVRRTDREEQREWKKADYGFTITEVKDEPEKEEASVPGKQEGGSYLDMEENMYLQPKSKFACFNILNFVVNSFAWKEYFDALHNSLLNALLTGQENAVWEEAMRRLKACSLEDDFRDWAKKCGYCAIPFQHFDMTYNIMKRQRETIDHGLPDAAPVSEFYTWCREVYKNISSALREQDTFFRKSYALGFQKTFDKNPFLQHFKEKDTDREFQDCLAQLAKELVKEQHIARRELLAERY